MAWRLKVIEFIDSRLEELKTVKTRNVGPQLMGNKAGPEQVDLSKLSEGDLRAYMQRILRVADKSGDGVLDKAELGILLGYPGFHFDASSASELMDLCDKDGNGVVGFQALESALHAISRHSSRHYMLLV